VGNPHGKKAWKLYDLDIHEYFENQDVVFDEDIFLFQDMQAWTKEHSY